MLYVVLRWIAVVESLVLIGWAIAVIQEAGKFRSPNLYVRLVTVSYILFVFTVGLRSALGANGTSRFFPFLHIAALTFGLAAMWAMYRHYRYDERVRRHQFDADANAGRLRREAGLDK